MMTVKAQLVPGAVPVGLARWFAPQPVNGVVELGLVREKIGLPALSAKLADEASSTTALGELKPQFMLMALA